MTDPAPLRTLRVLHLEDSDLDHELAMAHLQRAGLEVQARRIESRAEFAAALQGEWDLILSDYNLPGFSGLQALDMLRDSGRLWPFILVSGEIGEDTAVEAMRNGASDYLLKNNLARLAPAMEHAIEAAEARRARVAADEELQASRQRLAELAQHLQTSVEQERSAIARGRSTPGRRSRPAAPPTTPRRCDGSAVADPARACYEAAPVLRPHVPVPPAGVRRDAFALELYRAIEDRLDRDYR